MEKNRIYQIYELKDELKKAVENIGVVEAQEKLLVSIITMSPHKNQFEDFIKGTQENWKNYENQKTVLNTRIKKAEQLIAYHEKQDENSKIYDEAVSLTLEILGSVKPEKKK